MPEVHPSISSRKPRRPPCDGEVPAPQSYEFWHGLKTLGVETQFVVYAHEGHLFSDPKHQRDVIARTLAWFDAYLRQ